MDEKIQAELKLQEATLQEGNDLTGRIASLEMELEDIQHLLQKKTGQGSADIKSSQITGTVGTNSVATAAIQASAVTQAKIASNAVGQAQTRYETVTLAFASGDTSKTASVTSGSIIVGVYESVVTSTPVTGELQLSISATTLTGTRSAAPGGASAITYTVVLLKT